MLELFADPHSAEAALQRMTARYQGFERLMPILLNALGYAADPDRSLLNFERFAENYGAGLLTALEDNPRVVEILITLFSASHFLTEILLRNPGALALLLDRQELTRRKTIEQIQTEAELALRASPEAAMEALCLYQKAELLRIGASDLLGLYDLAAVVSQLSRLAIALVRVSLDLAARQTGLTSVRLAVLALGKLGGRELNYSSDIDLLFVTRDETSEANLLAQKLVELLSVSTPQGFLYRVDLRLRPWGSAGLLVPHTAAAVKYLELHAQPWEKQAWLKLRPIAGDLALGEQLREAAQPAIFSLPSEGLRAAVFAMKQRSEAFLREKGRTWGEVKLGAGSIRDVEFVVQYLQLAHVSQLPHIRTRATLKALPRLRAAGLLTSTEARVLSDGYVFLRTIEHYLQILDYRQTHSLPSEARAITLLARRLGFPDGEAFVARYQEHCRAIRAVYLHQVGSEPTFEGQPALRQHISRMDASYAEIFSQDEIRQQASLAARLSADLPVVVQAEARDEATWRVTIVGYDYPGELSLICGLFFVHGFNILDGDVFTYEPQAAAPLSNAAQRKIVDVFTVRSVFFEPHSAEVWQAYRNELQDLMLQLRAGQRRAASGALAKRVGVAFQPVPRPASGQAAPLLPIEIEIDNAASERYTVLRIEALDTFGFLYEFTNALMLARINVVRMVVRTVEAHAQNMLYVTDFEGRKIESPVKQRELRAAIVLTKHFTHLLPNAPNPEAALLHFRGFLEQLFLRPNWPDEIASLERSEVLKALARVLGVSDFLWDDLLRMQYASLFPVLRDVEALTTAKPRDVLQAELQQALKTRSLGEARFPDWRAALNAFKDRELFHIDMRHILELMAEFWDFSAELTDLTETVLTAALQGCWGELEERYGAPLLESGMPCEWSALALGKCGGRELGFASDIELMLVYAGAGQTKGPQVISCAEYYERLAQALLAAIQARQEGIFQVDFQLRPYGKAGSMAVALEAFRRYYAPGGPAWAYERQALVKLRPIAGSPALGAALSSLRDAYVYAGEAFDLTALRAMRERQVRHLVTGGTFNAKFSPGGLVDVEYLVQGLQIQYGADNPSLRSPNLRQALAALRQAGILTEADYVSLRKAHTFLRWLIDALRMVRGHAKDITVPPYESEEFAFLARRLRYDDDTERLRADLLRYQTTVQEVCQAAFESLFSKAS